MWKKHLESIKKLKIEVRMTINIKICRNEKEWNRLVDESTHATLFHTWKFLKIVEKHAKNKLYPLIGTKGTNPIGLYPLFYKKKTLVRMVFSPPPHCAVPYLGPLILNYNKLKQSKKEFHFIEFQRKVDEFISSELRANYISISTPLNLLDSRPLKWASYKVEPSYSYQLDLNKGLDIVWSQLKKKLRQNIKKEQKKGIVIQEGSKKELEIIYNSLIERYEEQDRMVTVPKRYLLELYDFFYPSNMKILVAEYEDENIGGLIDLYYKEKACSWIGNAKPKKGNVNATDLIQWEAINKAYKEGCRYYEEMGAHTERLCKYKSKYNPDLLVYYKARKYSPLGYLAEKGYTNFLKPLRSKAISKI